MYPYFTWKNISSLDKNIMVNKLPNFERPPANIEKIVISGRDGFLTQDDGTYQGTVKTCECSLDNGNIDDVCSWLTGSGEVTFSNEPDKNYKATIINKIPFSKIIPTFHSFIIQFDCQPHGYSTANALITLTVPTNMLVYNSTTWIEWVKPVGIVGGITGLEWTLDAASAMSAYINTNLKPSTKYGVLINIVSNNTNTYLRMPATQGLLNGVNFTTSSGNQKGVDISPSIITSNVITIKNNGFGVSGTKIKIKDFRIFELPVGSQIEWDFSNLTADQLNGLYPFSGATSGTIFNPSTANAKPIIKIYGTGTINLTVNSTAITLTNVVDYVTIDGQLMDCYKGTILKNGDMVGDFPILTVGTNTINWSGTVIKIEIQGNWRYL